MIKNYKPELQNALSKCTRASFHPRNYRCQQVECSEAALTKKAKGANPTESEAAFLLVPPLMYCSALGFLLS